MSKWMDNKVEITLFSVPVPILKIWQERWTWQSSSKWLETTAHRTVGGIV